MTLWQKIPPLSTDEKAVLDGFLLACLRSPPADQYGAGCDRLAIMANKDSYHVAGRLRHLQHRGLIEYSPFHKRWYSVPDARPARPTLRVVNGGKGEG